MVRLWPMVAPTVEDVAMISPKKMWAVRIGAGMEGAEGTLSLTDVDLEFELDEEEGAIRIPLEDIRKVKRVRGSPILLVDTDRSPDGKDQPARFAFYAVEPPSLRPQGRETKGKVRRHAIVYLQSANSRHKEDLDGWERELRAAVDAARRG